MRYGWALGDDVAAVDAVVLDASLVDDDDSLLKREASLLVGAIVV